VIDAAKAAGWTVCAVWPGQCRPLVEARCPKAVGTSPGGTTLGFGGWESAADIVASVVDSNRSGAEPSGAVIAVGDMPKTLSAELWKLRAEEARVVAEGMDDPVAKAAMMEVAAGYEKLARYSAAAGEKAAC
jgi:hypothetical protein